MKIAFIGLGNMGGPMAANLAAKGYAVTGFDIVPANLEKAAAHGVEAATSAEQAVQNADAVITMVPAGQHVLGSLSQHPWGGAAGTRCSSIARPSMWRVPARRMAWRRELTCRASMRRSRAARRALLRRPSPSWWEATSALSSAAIPSSAAMGKRIVHCGEAGAGQAAKICNNMILGISMIAVSEAFVLAEKLGLDAKALYEVASAASGQCWSLTTYCPVPGVGPKSPADNDYQPGFAAALMLKDLALAQQAAAETGAATPLGAHAEELYRRFSEAGGAAQDFSAIIRHLATSKRG